MKIGLLAFLACPACGGEIGFARLEGYPTHDQDIEECLLSCKACRAEYPVTEGIPRMRAGAGGARADKTRRSFSWEWLRYPGSRPGDEAIFLEETMLRRGDLAGKVVLDAGCGMGRYSAVALNLGAEVVAVDISEGLQRVAQASRKYPKLHAVEGDLLRPPLRKGAFDVVYSLGVLHHTADTSAAFSACAALVKRRGLFSAWVYGRAGAYRDFKTNPLRPGREFLARVRVLAWLVVAARLTLSDVLRLFTTRLPIPVVHALCVPLACLGQVPILKYLTYSTDPDFSARVLENFDWLAPPYQWHHTKEELSFWCQTAGFSVEKILPHGLVPKPGVLARRD